MVAICSSIGSSLGGLGQGAKDAVQTIDLKDGGKIAKRMMKNNAIWKTITEHGTLKPGH